MGVLCINQVLGTRPAAAVYGMCSLCCSVSGRLAVGGPLGQRAVGCLCLGAWTHFYHRGAVRLSRQRQHGAIEQARWARAWPQDAGGGAGRGAGRQP